MTRHNPIDVAARLRGGKRRELRTKDDRSDAAEGSVHTEIPAIVFELGAASSLAWLSEQRDAIVHEVLKHGAVLVRGFAVADPSDVREAARILCDRVLSYSERSTPRSAIGAQVYSVSEYPPHQTIDLHCENAYAAQWPSTLLFHCARPADRGGANLLADTRTVLQLLSPETVSQFDELQVLYVREFDPFLGVSWKYAFQCDSRAEVERRCAELGYTSEWFAGNRLRVTRIAPALHRHPLTQERVWFSHATFFHESSLPSEILSSIKAVYGDGFFPHRTFFGDGSQIGSATLSDLRSAYRAANRSILLRTNDLLIVDNMLMAHGRDIYEGARDIRLVMGDLLRRGAHS